MTILRERQVWRKANVQPARPSPLSRDEQENVRKALRVLQVRFGSWGEMAKLMGVSPITLQQAARQKPVSAAIVVLAAKVSKIPVEDLLSGAWPKPCPVCGRT